jgi:sulfite reductase alpha subunit-like flavoprotein
MQEQQQEGHGGQQTSSQQQQQPDQQTGRASAPLVPVWVERGALRMPADPTTPLLLIGPGTGVAPFRSFLWQRAALVRQGVAVAPSFLFFGCRSAAWDFYYAEEWGQLQELGVLDPAQGLITAFSRDPPEQQGDGVHALTHRQQQQQGTNGVHPDAVVPAEGAADNNSTTSSSSGRAGPKVYVTHRLRQHAALVWDLLSTRGAWVYVSGSADKMPADVAAALADVACQAGGLSGEEGAAYIRQLELKGRYHVEAWS